VTGKKGSVKNKTKKIFSNVAVAQSKRPIKNMHTVALRHGHTKGFVFFTVPSAWRGCLPEATNKKCPHTASTLWQAAGCRACAVGCIRGGS
jgi:hypothetical protein